MSEPNTETNAGPATEPDPGSTSEAGGSLPPTPPLVVDEPAEPARARPAAAVKGPGGSGGSSGPGGATGAGDASASRSGSRRATGSVVRHARELIATALMTVAVLAAVVLAAGAGLVATNANTDNRIVSLVLDLGSRVVGPFADMFTFEGEFAKGILVNWGIAALVYLIAGSILRRVIRP